MGWFENRVPPLALLGLFALAMAACAGLFGGLTLVLPGQRTASALVLLAGFRVIVAAVSRFRKARTTVDPLHPDAASALVTGGIFERSRNPMYLGMALALAAWALFLGNLVAVLFVAAFVGWIGRFQIAPEERALRARFGQEFETYAARVRRWI